MEECDQKNTSFSDKFGMLMPGLDTYFLKVSARVSLKAATKGFFRGQKIQKFSIAKVNFSKVKMRESYQKD